MVSVPPTLMKSKILYLPGANTSSDAGSKGAIMEIEAETITAIAKGLVATPISVAASIAIGNTTKTDAALDIGWVSKTVMSIKPAIKP